MMNVYANDMQPEHLILFNLAHIAQHKYFQQHKYMCVG